MKLFKTGDICPCCGQPIKLTDPEALLVFSALVGVLGLCVAECMEDKDGK